MAQITFIGPDGTVDVVEALPGRSVMQIARANNVSGIVAECGGNAMCGTCHVYVDEADLRQLPPVSDEEDAMLNFTISPRESNSRLSCQLSMGNESAGLTVRIPEKQI